MTTPAPPALAASQVFTFHESFAASREKFMFLMDSYQGTGGYEDGSYLDPHTRELRINLTTGDILHEFSSYTNRKKRAYYPNIIKTVVNVPVQYVYQAEIVREGPDDYKKFVEDCTGRGTPINTMFENLMRYARLFGAMFFVIDKPRAEPAANRADELKSDARPRILPIFPTDVIDWYMQDGRLRWVKILERYDESSDWMAPRKCGYRVRVWTETEWFLYDVDTEDELILNPFAYEQRLKLPKPKGGKDVMAGFVSRGTHPLGEVPLVGVYNDEPEFGDLYANTDVFQSSKTNKRLYNAVSELQQIIREQTFSVLTMPVENPDQPTNQVVGILNGIAYKPTQGGLSPQYISPDGSCAQTIRTEVEDLRKEIYRAANLHYAEGVQEVRSGVAKAWTFDQTNRFLAGLAKRGEAAERKAAELVLKWQGSKESDTKIVVQYPGTFNISDLMEEIEIADAIIAMRISKTLSGKVSTNLVRKMFPTIGREELEKITKEINESDMLNPPPAVGPTSQLAAGSSLRARIRAKRGQAIAGAQGMTPQTNQ